MFTDYAKITIKSGNGGDGHVSFRREKYVPNGGPDGGDGGKGGDVVFLIDSGTNTLADFRHRRKYAAGNGEEGGKRRCHGKDGTDIVLKVPAGTIIREASSGKIVADMSGGEARRIILQGGAGGLGNMHFATSRMQAPNYAKPGKPGIELDVILELKVIADVGIIGLPNAGKSTFLSRVTNADPKIGNYPFTTIDPNLGVVDMGDGNSFVVADMPGLIEGASGGAGLGHEFLRHIQRTKVLLHLVDVSPEDGHDPVRDIRTINDELAKFDAELINKPMIIGANKIDALGENVDSVVNRIKDEFKSEGIDVYPISAVSGNGVKELLNALYDVVSSAGSDPIVYEADFSVADLIPEDEPYEVYFDEKNKEFVAEGPLIEKMLGYTNLNSDKGFIFFQKFLKERGIDDKLKELGVAEGDTVRIYGHYFEYYE